MSPCQLRYLLDHFTLIRAVDPVFYMVGLLLPLAVLSGYGLAWLLDRLQRRATRWMLTGLLGCLVLAGQWLGPYQGTTDYIANSFYRQLAKEPGDFAIIQLPMGYDEGKYQLYRKQCMAGPSPPG